MHYRHLFHAGNFADVFKHVLLVGLLQSLNRKDKPWAYLDTHAGAGGYNLAADAATRTGEWIDGVGRLHGHADTPPLVRTWLDLLGWDESDPALRDLRHYPGSPRLAAKLARPGDRVICCEAVPDVAAQLRAHVPDATVHVRDGYESHALWPPPQRRGLVLIDPPFEARDEFERMAGLIDRLHQRAAGTVLAAWYPRKQGFDAQRFVRRVARRSTGQTLCCELDIGATGTGRLHACGLVVVNPPFGFEEPARETLAWLAARLGRGRSAQFRVETAVAAGVSPRLQSAVTRR